MTLTCPRLRFTLSSDYLDLCSLMALGHFSKSSYLSNFCQTKEAYLFSGTARGPPSSRPDSCPIQRNANDGAAERCDGRLLSRMLVIDHCDTGDRQTSVNFPMKQHCCKCSRKYECVTNNAVRTKPTRKARCKRPAPRTDRKQWEMRT